MRIWPADGLTAFAEICGELLARGHARSGDPLVIAGYLGSGDSFAEALGQVWLALCRPDGERLAGAAAFGQGKAEAVKLAFMREMMRTENPAHGPKPAYSLPFDARLRFVC